VAWDGMVVAVALVALDGMDATLVWYVHGMVSCGMVWMGLRALKVAHRTQQVQWLWYGSGSGTCGFGWLGATLVWYVYGMVCIWYGLYGLAGTQGGTSDTSSTVAVLGGWLAAYLYEKAG
jgi:hypothetical protein